MSDTKVITHFSELNLSYKLDWSYSKHILNNWLDLFRYFQDLW